MAKADPKIARTVSWIAAIVAIVVALILPLGYFGLSYQNQAGELEAEAEINGHAASEIINANPEFWRFQQSKLEEFLSRRPRHGEAEVRRILDPDNKVVAESAVPLRPPLLTRSMELRDSGVTVGRIEISRSLLPLLLRTAGVALFSLLLSLGVFAALKILPLRALDRAVADNTRLYQEALERAEKLKAFNELARLITSSLSTQEVFDFIVSSGAKLLNAKMVRLWIEDHASGGFTVHASYGVAPELLKQTTTVPVIRPGEGVLGEIIETRTPAYILDAREEPRWLNKQMVKALGLVSVAAVPIIMGDRVLGVLTMMTGARREFTGEEKDLLKGLADQAAVAIENARLYEETERKAQEQEALNAIATATSQSLDLDELLQISLDRVLDVTGREQGYIRLKDPVTGKLRLAARRGVSKEYIEVLLRRRTPGGKGDQVFESGEVLVINDPEKVPLKEETRREGRHSLIWIPLKAQGKVVGLLNVTTNRPIPFAPREVELLQAVGNVIGVALENARLFGETKSNLERIRALREIDKAITSTLDLEAVLNILLQKIDLVLPYSATTVRLFNKQSGLLEPVACRNLDEKEWKSEEWKSGRGTPNVAFESKAPVMVGNVQTDPRVRDPEFFRKHGLVSFLGVPLIVQDEVLGVISFYTKEEHEFSNEETEFLATLAGQAAIAIHNSQLYQEMTKLAADLSRSNKVKDEFLSIMSHELRTPLNVVMGYTGMIKDRLLGEINPEQENALEKVISRARDQLTMISSILQATQLEAEGAKVNSHQVPLKEFLDELRLNYSIPVGKEVSLVWDYSPDLPPINTDAEKLKHVLHNLINNAIKFTDRGAVTVSVQFLSAADSPAPRIGEGVNRGKGAVQFTVADTGIAIAKENFSMIFEKFRQLDSSETRRFGGVGIGLYIVKQFTEVLGGEVTVESEVGKGSTFTVTIPVATHQQAGKEEAKGLTLPA